MPLELSVRLFFCLSGRIKPKITEMKHNSHQISQITELYLQRSWAVLQNKLCPFPQTFPSLGDATCQKGTALTASSKPNGKSSRDETQTNLGKTNNVEIQKLPQQLEPQGDESSYSQTQPGWSSCHGSAEVKTFRRKSPISSGSDQCSKKQQWLMDVYHQPVRIRL